MFIPVVYTLYGREGEREGGRKEEDVLEGVSFPFALFLGDGKVREEKEYVNERRHSRHMVASAS